MTLDDLLQRWAKVIDQTRPALSVTAAENPARTRARSWRPVTTAPTVWLQRLMTSRHVAADTVGRRPGQDVLDSVDSYLAELLSAISPLPPRRLGLDDVDGAVLAEDVAARRPPPAAAVR